MAFEDRMYGVSYRPVAVAGQYEEGRGAAMSDHDHVKNLRKFTRQFTSLGWLEEADQCHAAASELDLLRGDNERLRRERDDAVRRQEAAETALAFAQEVLGGMPETTAKEK
jgi:hypothetical protein